MKDGIIIRTMLNNRLINKLRYSCKGRRRYCQGNQQVHVKLETTKGDLHLKLFADQAPETVANFVSHVRAGTYNNTIFHKVIPKFMIQGGGYNKQMNQIYIADPKKKSLNNEWKNGLKHHYGSVAMARVGGYPHSATTQFFINLSNNMFLNNAQPDDAGFAVFGEVVEGMDLVESISKMDTVSVEEHTEVPKEPVIIENARVVE
eukprot:TRINITY_DN4363_c0_g3_i2.p1 TRINITY_DN4363_c0_g3~~TRINITY_DN4363_c0_g3_i2.p1  ORF type:complete len:204 (+),score=28.58 TRINITY_DN4363_c0_g3_i2:1-612(+)